MLNIPIKKYLWVDRIPLSLFCFLLATPSLAQQPPKPNEAKQEAFTSLSIPQIVQSAINCVVLSPNNSDEAIIAFDNGSIKACQFKEKTWKFVLPIGDSKSGSVVCLVISSDGKFLAASRNSGNIEIYTLDKETWGKATLVTTTKPVKNSKANDTALCMAFAPSLPGDDAKTYHIAVGWQSGGVSVFDFTPGKTQPSLNLPPAKYHHKSPTYCLAFSTDRKYLVSGSISGELTSHDPNDTIDTKNTQDLDGPAGAITAVAFDPNDSKRLYFTAPADTVIFEEDMEAKKISGQHKSKRGAISLAVGTLADGKKLIVTGYRDGSVLFALSDDTPIASGSDKPEHKGAVLALAVSPNGTRLLSGDDKGAFLVWQPKSSSDSGKGHQTENPNKNDKVKGTLTIMTTQGSLVVDISNFHVEPSKTGPAKLILKLANGTTLEIPIDETNFDKGQLLKLPTQK